jgi:transposase
MSGVFAPVAREIAPQAKVVHDLFHVSKHLNETVDQVRRKENKILQAEGNERLIRAKLFFNHKQCRKVFMKNYLNLFLNITLFPLANTVAEGFNSKIQFHKADARSFRNALNDRTRILFYCGRLDLFPSTHEIT